MRVTWATLRLASRLWLALVGLGLVVTIALSAHAALRAIAAHPVLTLDVPTARIGYEAQDHFPGAALLYAVQDVQPATDQGIAAPAQGVTGTTPLPALPADAAQFVAGDAGVVPARPFSMTRATGIDRSRAQQCLAAAIYYEAASEPDAGQQAVAQVILNRARHPAFPATVCGVVYQGSEHAGCQFSFACDGAMARIPSRSGWTRAWRTAGAALAGYVFAPVGLATHYHTYAVTPAWNRALVMTDAVGAHFFHRWKGYWGTAIAFSQIYRGGEPLPGPHATIEPVVPVVEVPVTVAAATPLAKPVTPAATIRPAYVESGRAIAPPLPAASGDHLPAASPILDKWRDSGKPF